MNVDVHDSLPVGFADFVRSMRFGAGAARYRRADVDAQLARFADPRYLVATDEGVMVGSYVLDARIVSVEGARDTWTYRALLGVAPSHRGRGVGRVLVARANALLDEAGTPSWGCIDEGNDASLGLLRTAGARDVGGLASWLAYRQWPRDRVPLEPLEGRLAEAHARTATPEALGLADVTPSGGEGYALVEGERIVAAARVRRTVLAFDTLGPVNDALVRRLVLPFGFARRRFDPRAFAYLRLTDIVLAPGDERKWAPFVSTLMARYGVHYALIVMDPSRTEWRRLRAASGRRARAKANLRVLVRMPGGSGHVAAGPLDLPPVDV